MESQNKLDNPSFREWTIVQWDPWCPTKTLGGILGKIPTYTVGRLGGDNQGESSKKSSSDSASANCGIFK